MGGSDGTRNRHMARLAELLTLQKQIRLMTWLVIAMMAMPVTAADAAAESDGQGMAQAQMSMICDHDDAPEMTRLLPGAQSGNDNAPCCPDCDMPDCSAHSSGSALTILAGVAQEAPLFCSASHRMLGDRAQISAETDTPRKPPRV